MEEMRTALRDHVDDVELIVASVSEGNYSSFKSENATYVNLQAPGAPKLLPGFRRIWFAWQGWQGRIDFPGLLKQCLRIVQDYQPDVIHVHGTEYVFGLIAAQTRIPVVISLQGNVNMVSRFYFRGMSLRDCLREIAATEFLRGKGTMHEYRKMVRRAEREYRVFHMNKYFVGRTNWDRGIAHFLSPGSSYFHCDEVMRLPFYVAQWKGESQCPFVIYCTSGDGVYKGLECLLEAVAILRNSGYACRLRIAGNIKGKSIWRWANRHVSRLRVGDLIDWLGDLDADEIARELSMASVYVLASHIENSPNSLAEAMLVGTPCVASFVGGVPSLLRHEQEGLLYQDGDPYSLAASILGIWENPGLAARLSENARQVAHKRHDRTAIAKTMLSIYQQVSAATPTV